MRIPALALALLALASPALAQDARNAVYFELGGSGVVPTFNYERRVSDRWTGRAGFSWVVGESENDTDTTFVVPLTASWLSHPASSHHLELGGGLTFAFGDEQDFYDIGDEEEMATLLATGIVGYRYQKPGGGFQFRSAFTPVVGDGIAIPWFGISFGYAW